MVKGMRIEWNLSQMPVTRGAENLRCDLIQAGLLTCRLSLLPPSRVLRVYAVASSDFRNLLTVTKFVQDFHLFPFSMTVFSAIDRHHLNVIRIIACVYLAFNFHSHIRLVQFQCPEPSQRR